MNRLAVVVFDSEKQAREGSRGIRDLDQQGTLTLHAEAVITKDASGTVSVVHSPDEGPIGVFSGFMVGSMIGVLGGPVGVAIGAGTGTMVGAAIDLTREGIGSDFIEEVSESLEPGKAAVVADFDEGWQTPLDSRMELLGGRIFRRNRIQIEDACYEKEIAAYEAELDALETEMENASAAGKAKLEVKVQQTKEKIRIKREDLKEFIESVQKEGDAKVESLQRQIAAARCDQKMWLEKRLAEVRSDYELRTAKLEEAFRATLERSDGITETRNPL